MQQPSITKNNLTSIPIYLFDTPIPSYLNDVDIVFKFFVYDILPKEKELFKYLNPQTADYFLWRLGLIFNEYRSRDRTKMVPNLRTLP